MNDVKQNSGGNEMTLADFPNLRAQLEAWRTGLAQTDWTPWLIIGFAALLRFFLLGIKPPHFDEGINGWFVDAHIVKQGFYRYDPTNYHGPLHFYMIFLSESLFGRNLWALRLPVVLVSIACVWLTLKFEPFFGRNLSRIAAIAMAVSPGFVFYGRYSIHEVWLVLFSMMFVFGLLGLWKFGTPKYLWCTGLGIAGMILTKETYLIHISCAAIAAGVCYFSNWLNPVADSKSAKQEWDIMDLAFVVVVGIAIIIFFYSGTFFHWSGVKGIFKAYSAWFETGTNGHGHEKPWYYWLKLIALYEWPILIGLVVCLFCQQLKNLYLRYLAIYGVGVLIAYSIVAYKTPWCIISIVWPFVFVFAAALLIVPAANRFIANIIVAVLLCASLGSAIRLNYFRCTTETEPYVYVQTYNDVWKLSRPLLTLAKRNPIYYQVIGHFIRGSSYPFPWLLGDFPNVGYYEHDNLPSKLDADFLLVQEDKIETVEGKLQDSYYTDSLTIRPYQDTSKIYLSERLFKSFFPDRQPDFKGKGPN